MVHSPGKGPVEENSVPKTGSAAIRKPKDLYDAGGEFDEKEEIEVFSQFRRDYEDWDDQTQDDRDDAILSREYYDGNQWTNEQIDELNKRGQPIITKNLIAPKINFVLGSETENRVSPKAYPRTLYHELDAEVATDGLRYATEVDNFNQSRSAVAKDMAIEGFGGVDFDICCECLEEHEDECPEPRIKAEHVLWDRLYYDPKSRKFDFSDAKYVGIIVWMHREDALEYFLDDDLDKEEYNRLSYTIDAAYARDYTSGDGTEDAPRRWRDSDDRVQFFKTYRQVDGDWYVAYWTWSGWIRKPTLVPFKDEKGRNYCPLVLSSCFVSRNNVRYGLVRNMISPQDEVNKRASKALHLMHTTRVLAEEGAVQNPDTFQAQLARPDGLATVLPGRLKDNSIQILDNVQLAQAQLIMGDKAEAAINLIGPHAALVASDQRAQSGRAFIARQQAGSMEIKPYFDHLRHWTLRCYRTYWYLIKQYWSAEKWFRVRDDVNHNGFRFVSINRVMTRGERIKELVEGGMEPKEAASHVLGPDGVAIYDRIVAIVQQQEMQQQQQMQQAQQVAMQAQQAGQPVPPQVAQMLQQPQQKQSPLQLLLSTPSAQEEFVDSDVAQLDVDIVLDTAPASPIVREEQYAELLKLLQTNAPLIEDPAVRNRLLAYMFQHSDLRDEAKRQFVEALMPKPPSAEEQQQMAQQQQMQQQQMQLALAQLQATVQKLQADAAKSQAQAQKASAETQVTVPSAAQLDQAQAAKAMADAQLKPQEAQLLQAQTEQAFRQARESATESTTSDSSGGEEN